MPTAAGASSTPAKFALRFAAWFLGIFGAVRLPWVELHLITPFANAQGNLATAAFGTPTAPVITTLACSGADAIAICLAAVLAYPVRWRSRIMGALAGLALITAINIIRIGTLGRAADSSWFNALHVYVWPAILTAAIGAYVYFWTGAVHATPLAPKRGALADRGPARTFVVATIALTVLFIALSPLYLDSQTVLGIAAFIARTAAATLNAIGVQASHTGNLLLTDRGALLVTQECITTPLIPVYLAAVTAFASTKLNRAIGYLAAVPIFIALGVARLMVVALPAALVASPLFLIHAFYQLLLGAVIVAAFAIWRHGRRHATGPILAGLAAGASFVWLAGPRYAQVVAAVSGLPAGAPVDDPQGAVAFLPSFQVGLYLALAVAAFAWASWPRHAAGLTALVASQVAVFAGLRWLQTAGLLVEVRDVRAWAVAVPLLLFLLAHRAASHRLTTRAG